MPVSPLQAADILNRNTGQASDVASTSVTLTGGVGSGTATAGTALLAMVHSGTQMATPSGWTKDQETGADAWGWVAAFRRTAHSTGDASWTFAAVSGTTGIQWQVLEVNRLLGTLTGGGGQAFSSDPNGNGTTQVIVTKNDTFLLGMQSIKTTASQASLAGMTVTWLSTRPYTVNADLRWATDGASNLQATAFYYFPYPLARLGYDFSIANGPGDMTSTGGWANLVVAYESVNSSRPDCLDLATGFEYGLTPNTAAPLTTRRLVDLVAGTWGTQYLVSTAAPRSGTYHLRIVQAAAAGRVGWDTNTLGTSKDDCCFSFGVKINSSTGTVVLAEIAPASGTILQLVYDTSTSKLGLRWGSGGTASWQTQTTPTGTYVWVDLLADGFTGTTKSAEWFVDGGEEDGPANLTGQGASSLLSAAVGLNASQTVTFDVDDVCISTARGDYPLAPHNVRLLTVDPAASMAVSGTSANLQTFSANGTLAAWNAATARGAIDEVPPTISASADGLVQITADVNTYVNIAFGTYTLLAGEFIDYVGHIVALWANSAQTATLFIGPLGTETPLTTATAFNPGNAAQPPSLTVPMWLSCKATQPTNWEQASLNGATGWVGKSSDATPDIGIHAYYLEVAVRERSVKRVYGPDEDGMTVDMTQASANHAVQVYDVACGPTYGATLRYVLAGVEVVRVIAAAGTLSETVGSGYADDVSRVQVEPDAVPNPVD